jgi:hypothetical protein
MVRFRVRVRVRVRVKVAACVAVAFSVLTEFKVPTGKRSEHPRGMALVARMAALQVEEQKSVKLNGILECVNSVQTRALDYLHPDGANPNTAESMVKP